MKYDLKKEKIAVHCQTLENGTVLEVGKKYCFKESSRGDFIKITALGRDNFLYLKEDEVEIKGGYIRWQGLIPYQEPKEKDLENFEIGVTIVFTDNSKEVIDYVYLSSKQFSIPACMSWITLEEAKQRGLNINF